MKVLIACEESQVVCKAFRARGHEAYSNDLRDCSGGHPEWHLKMDVFRAIEIAYWDLMVAHPPCEHLCFSGERWFHEGKKDWALRQDAFDFFMRLYYSDIPRVCIENSHSIAINQQFRKPDQTVHPYHFGDPYKKSTCLWLRALKPLMPTNILWQRYPKAHREAPGAERKGNRARTEPGIAKAMAEQWG